jgi:hypothetical protein
MPDGTTIRTIGEAARYATKLPKKIAATEPWQAAVKSLMMASEHGGPFVFISRISFYRAVYGETPPPIGNPEGKKGHKWGPRKLARDR